MNADLEFFDSTKGFGFSADERVQFSAVADLLGALDRLGIARVGFSSRGQSVSSGSGKSALAARIRSGGIYHSFSVPATLEINFSQSRVIQEIDVVAVRDSFTDKSSITLPEMFTAYGVTEFTIASWNGSA